MEQAGRSSAVDLTGFLATGDVMDPTRDPPAATFLPGAPLGERPGVRVLEHPIFARLMGHGPPALLIHGMTVSGEMFAPIAEQLAATHQLIIPDLSAANHGLLCTNLADTQPLGATQNWGHA